MLVHLCQWSRLIFDVMINLMKMVKITFFSSVYCTDMRI